MKCKIVEIDQRDGWYSEKELFIGMIGEFLEDDVFEWDEDTGWARGWFYSDTPTKVTMPVFFADVRIEEMQMTVTFSGDKFESTSRVITN